MSYAYLAQPYSSDSLRVREERFLIAGEVCRVAHSERVPIYSPIAQWHPIAKRNELPGDVEYWWAQNRSMIFGCRIFVVLALEGWKQSSGIVQEREYFLSISSKAELTIGIKQASDPEFWRRLRESEWPEL